jgi:hypothetical protein
MIFALDSFVLNSYLYTLETFKPRRFFRVVWFEVLLTFSVKIPVFWNVTPCSLCLVLASTANSSTLKMEAVRSSESSIICTKYNALHSRNSTLQHTVFSNLRITLLLVTLNNQYIDLAILNVDPYPQLCYFVTSSSFLDFICTNLVEKCLNHAKFKQEVLGRTNRLLSLIRHGPHWKRSVQQL